MPPNACNAALSEATQHRAPEDIGTEDYVYQWLQDIGAPVVSQDDLHRLYKGPFADVLLFVARHIRGRRETAVCRHQFQCASTSERKSAAPQACSSFSVTKRTKTRLDGAKLERRAAEDSLRNLLNDTYLSQREADRLQDDLQLTRGTNLLLRVLAQKESNRIARLVCISDMMMQLRKDISSRKSEKGRLHETGMRNTNRYFAPHIRADHTQDVLASFHSFHVRLSHLWISLQSSKQEGERSGEARLMKAISDAMNLHMSDERVILAHCSDRLKKQTRLRCSQNLRYHSLLPAFSEAPDDAELDKIQKRIMEKERKLQSLSDLSIALIHASSQSLQSLSTFSAGAAPILQQELQDKASAVQGYVDLLRHSVSKRTKVVAEHCARDPIKLGRGKSVNRILSEVQRSIELVHEKECFLRNATSIDPAVILPNNKDELAKRLETHKKRQAELNEQITLLLRHKLDKAHAGRPLEHDTERIAQEICLVGSMSGLR
ncbi:uncharacterized protein LAESUDRAFT_753004 [Laetiporus sulphureus 93-53]|uniref:Uncharacterized protein n=1 Tax=Laetiporus sulphureus 93-53 TaxID=1314785 RepID=A0A165BDW1_9APHY|nr:uncharacterized protein LAESUDRAFT_753004 [Laetiporus sulphureus 93-53]KZT00833.1 hypothetical protein LAESUDRAFT_753004 [Laetiporus sulphureus 93-53]